MLTLGRGMMMAVGSCRGSSQGEEERTRPWTGEQRAPSPESEGWGGVEWGERRSERDRVSPVSREGPQWAEWDRVTPVTSECRTHRSDMLVSIRVRGWGQHNHSLWSNNIYTPASIYWLKTSMIVINNIWLAVNDLVLIFSDCPVATGPCHCKVLNLVSLVLTAQTPHLTKEWRREAL